jgi:hypothetical protein
MAEIPLVSENIEDGRKLIVRLMENGFRVTAAAWVKESDRPRWYLYLASPDADRGGPREGYRDIAETRRQMPPSFSIGPLQVRLLGATDLIARAIQAYRDRFPDRTGVWYDKDMLEEREIDSAYVYGSISVASSTDAPHGVA